MPPLNAPDDLQRLQRWLSGQGATFHGMKLVDQGQGHRQAIASRKILQGSLVLHMPRPLLMDAASARYSQTGRALLTRHPDATDTALLAAQLLDVQRHGGLWMRYCQTLPRCFPEHPLFFSEQQLQELQGSYTVRVIKRHQARQQREYLRLCESQTGIDTFSQDDHALAWATVLTRRFDVRLDGTKTAAMIPAADMPDHALEPNLQWASESSRGFFLTAARDIEAGTPLTIRYWRQCNGLTLATYGFSLDENPNNVAELRFPDMPSTLASGGSEGPEPVVRNGHRIFTVSVRAKDVRVQHMLAYLLGLAGSLVAALEMLRSACHQRLKEFSTTAADDVALLKKTDLPLWQRYVVRVRLDEKLVLHGLASLDDQQWAKASHGV